MRKYILPLISGLICLTQIGLGQIVLTCSNASGAAGSTLEVDLTVNNFTNIATLQYSIDWDPAVLTYIETINFNTGLEDFNSGNVASNNPGDHTTSWADPSLMNGTLPAGARLYTLRFNIVGQMCDESIVLVTDMPSDIEITNSNFEELTPTIVPGTASVDGVDCNGGGDDVTIIGSMETAAPGTNVCVTISADNFIDIQSVQGGFGWNEAIIMFTGLQNFNPAIPGLGNSSFNTTDSGNGVIQMVFFNGHPDAVPITVPDGTPLFEMCFDVIGTIGQMSTINFGDYGVEPEVLTESNGVVPVFGVDGKVTIADGPAMNFTTTISDVDGDSGDMACVDFTVQNFTDILTMQYTIVYDPAVLSYVGPSALNLGGLGEANFNASPPDKINFSWVAPGSTSIDVANGTVIYQLCFNIIAECESEATSEVAFVRTNDLEPGDLEIEITDGSAQVIDPVVMNDGSVTVKPCISECMTTVDHPDCAGQLSGNITATVEVSGTCDCVWYKNGVEIQRGSAPNNCNLNGVGAGVYRLEIECNGVVECMKTATLVDPPAITISGDITDATCGSGGSIDVDLMNDVGTVTYNWNPTQPNQASISNLTPDTYSLTVTDGNGCTANSSFDVEDTTPSAISITLENSVNVACFGESTGSLEISVMGGCPGYTILWNTTPAQPGTSITDLSMGTYTVTVTDDQGSTSTAQYSITQPTALAFTSTVVQNSTGMDGSITVVVNGGTMPYSYAWTPAQPNSNMITNLAPGNYTVTVTDDNGCTIASEVITVPPAGSMLVVDNLMAGSDFNGFNVACNGDCTESITGTLSGGALPVTVTLSGTSTATKTLSSLGSFSFTGLCAGNYTVKFTSNTGFMLEFTETITQPTALQQSATTQCETGQNGDGSITLNISGGVGEYTYDWVGIGNVASDLTAGTYQAIVTDDNGCTVMSTAIVTACPDNPNPCYEATTIITPNNDGFNEFFTIMCATDFPATLYVYDRYGQKVYTQANYDSSWAGVHTNGTDLTEGAYMWVLDVNFGAGRREAFKGTLTILRSN